MGGQRGNKGGLAVWTEKADEEWTAGLNERHMDKSSLDCRPLPLLPSDPYRRKNKATSPKWPPVLPHIDDFLVLLPLVVDSSLSPSQCPPSRFVHCSPELIHLWNHKTTRGKITPGLLDLCHTGERGTCYGGKKKSLRGNHPVQIPPEWKKDFNIKLLFLCDVFHTLCFYLFELLIVQ